MIVISRQSVSYENTGKRRRLRLRLQRLILQLIVGNCRFARAALCAYWMTRSMRQYQIWLEAISNEPSAPLCNRPLGQQQHTSSSSRVPGTLLLVNVAQLLPLALSICSHCLETKDRRQTKTERLPPFDVNNNWNDNVIFVCFCFSLCGSLSIEKCE